MLIEYDPDGNAVGSVPLARTYGDIAINAAGTTIYAVTFDTTRRLFEIDPATGLEISSLLMTGIGFGTPNALAWGADGNLLLGLDNTSDVYSVDPETGVATEIADFPAGHESGGDFATLAGGEVITFANGGAVFVINDNGTMTQIGTAPYAYATAMSGNELYIFDNEGQIHRVADVPTAASTEPFVTELVVDTGLEIFGAASVQDSGCSAPVAACTGEVNFWASTPNPNARLIEYDVDGNAVGSVPLAHTYGDIAINPAGTVIYAVTFDESRRLFEIDPATGLEISSLVMTGMAFGTPNSLAWGADGNLLLGVDDMSDIYSVDPETGVAIEIADFPATHDSGGDFATLSGGEVIAFSDEGAVFVINDDGTVTQIGTAPVAYATAMSGNELYIFDTEGSIHRVANVPTVASTEPFVTELVVDTGLSIYGAASVEDSGCPDPVEPAAPTLPDTGASPVVPGALGILALLAGGFLFASRYRVRTSR